MQRGVVKFFHSDGRNWGFLACMATGEEVFFHRDDGHAFRTDRTQVRFSEDSTTRRPASAGGEWILFERTERAEGPRAAQWGFYDDYREEYAKLAQKLLPEFSLHEYPFLVDVIIKAQRLFDHGEFRVCTQHISPSVLQEVGMDHPAAGELSYFFATGRRGSNGWVIHELASAIRYPADGVERQTAAEAVGKQLDKLSISPYEDDVYLVRLDVKERGSRLKLPDDISPQAKPSVAAEQKRVLTVFQTQ